MRWHAQDYAKKVTSIVPSGRRCSRCGKKRERLVFIGKITHLECNQRQLTHAFSHNRGLATQLVRQIPNTAIMMATYEAVVYVLTKHYQTGVFYSENGNSNSKGHQPSGGGTGYQQENDSTIDS